MDIWEQRTSFTEVASDFLVDPSDSHRPLEAKRLEKYLLIRRAGYWGIPYTSHHLCRNVLSMSMKYCTLSSNHIGRNRGLKKLYWPLWSPQRVSWAVVLKSIVNINHGRDFVVCATTWLSHNSNIIALWESCIPKSDGLEIYSKVSMSQVPQYFSLKKPGMICCLPFPCNAIKNVFWAWHQSTT